MTKVGSDVIEQKPKFEMKKERYYSAGTYRIVGHSIYVYEPYWTEYTKITRSPDSKFVVLRSTRLEIPPRSDQGIRFYQIGDVAKVKAWISELLQKHGSKVTDDPEVYVVPNDVVEVLSLMRRNPDFARILIDQVNLKETTLRDLKKMLEVKRKIG